MTRGYGKIGDRTTGKPRVLTVTRLLVADRDGLDYDDHSWVARHTCDNPPCCNLAHLVAGTGQDNIEDAVSRGRTTRGERNPASRLTVEDVREIRRLCAAGVRRPLIAAQFGIEVTGVSRIYTRRSWAWLDSPA